MPVETTFNLGLIRVSAFFCQPHLTTIITNRRPGECRWNYIIIVCRVRFPAGGNTCSSVVDHIASFHRSLLPVSAGRKNIPYYVPVNADGTTWLIGSRVRFPAGGNTCS